jgi:hypothetical protein
VKVTKTKKEETQEYALNLETTLAENALLYLGSIWLTKAPCLDEAYICRS